MAQYDQGGGCSCGLYKKCICYGDPNTPEPPKPFIGMKVWAFDGNRRVYNRDANGRSIGSPIWREKWYQVEIVGETSRSWLVGPEWCKKDLSRANKVPKKDWPARYALSEDDIDKAVFVNDKYQLAERIQRCYDYDTLKVIEKALNKYDLLPEDKKKSVHFY